MFSDKKSKEASLDGNQQNRITVGTSIEGDFISKTSMRIDGSIQGTVKTPSKVVIGEKGFVNGSLESEQADIHGKFSGNMTISGTLTLRATAQVEGDVIAGKLAIEPGASFNATCVMKGTVKHISDRKKDTQQDSQSHASLFERQKTNTKAKQSL